VKVDYIVRGGSATGRGVDFNFTAGSLVFNSNGTQNITLTTVPDGFPEGDETVQLEILNIIGANGGQTTHIATISDQAIPEPFTDSISGLPAVPTGSVTLLGHVLPNGLNTNTWFEWGSTTAMTSKTAEVAIGNGTAQVSTSATITGLVYPAPTYHRAGRSKLAGHHQGHHPHHPHDGSGGGRHLALDGLQPDLGNLQRHGESQPSGGGCLV